MSMGKKKKATQSFPFEFYCIAIGRSPRWN